MKETKRHHDAFLFYFEQDKRSLRGVARKFKVSDQTMTKWNREFEWQKRVQEKDKRINDIQEKNQEKTIAQRKVDYGKILRGTISQYVSRLKGEPYKCSKCDHVMRNCPNCQNKIYMPKMNVSVFDFKEMVKLDLLLSGEATDISLVKVEKIHKVIHQMVLVVAEYVPPEKLKEMTERLRKMEVLGDD